MAVLAQFKQYRKQDKQTAWRRRGRRTIANHGALGTGFFRCKFQIGPFLDNINGLKAPAVFR